MKFTVFNPSFLLDFLKKMLQGLNDLEGIMSGYSPLNWADFSKNFLTLQLII